MPGVCCPHEWQPAVTLVPREEQCFTCGSTCERDAAGKIVRYDRGNADLVRSTYGQSRRLS